MCEPISLIMGLVSIAGAGIGMLGASKMKTPEPPKVETPALPAPVSETPETEVKLGAADDTSEILLSPEERRKRAAMAKRNTGNTLGNLGKTSLI